MKALIQRVTHGSVSVDDNLIGETGKGFVVLLGVRSGDSNEDARQLAHKTVNLRVFPDAEYKMNLAITDVQGEILVISQFTLYANTKKGNRPSFVEAAPPEEAERLYRVYVEALKRALGETRVATGSFGAMMRVEIINDGPVTIELSTDVR